ncbi:MAG: holo-ACP synthase [Chloroflexota bacterium]
MLTTSPSGLPPSPADRRLTIGVDLVTTDRVARLDRESPGALATVFTAVELAYCAGRRRRHEHLAARFAAKEAVLKALGRGLSRGLDWSEVEVVATASGRPEIRLHGNARAWAESQGVTEVEISLSHSGGLAIATAMVVFAQPPA